MRFILFNNICPNFYKGYTIYNLIYLCYIFLPLHGLLHNSIACTQADDNEDDDGGDDCDYWQG